MGDRLDRAASRALTVAALVMAGALVHREFFAQPPQQSPGRPEFIPEWNESMAVGQVLGRTDAAIKLVEFADLECPYCAKYHETIEAVLQKYPREVAFVFVHYPLPGHRFATPAARAAECAGQQGHFFGIVSLIYAKQDSLGLKSWASFANEAGISDTARFRRCNEGDASFPSIEKGAALARKWRVSGTPTVLLNGWRLPSPPSDTQLVRAINDVLAGREPYPKD